MAKTIKPKDDELDKDLEQEVKPTRETFVTRWFRENCVDNPEDIRKVCELTAMSVSEQFAMEVSSSHAEVFAIVFFGTFQSILEFLRGKQKSYGNYTIQIGRSINIGYSNSSSEDNEKLGNFMPILEYVGDANRNIVQEDGGSPDQTTRNFIAWKNLNSKKSIDYLKEIQDLSYARLLEEYRTDLRTAEGIIPIFSIFMDNINNLLRMKYRESVGTKVSEIEISVMGLFKAFYSFDEESGKEFIEYTPSPFFKLSLKNDNVASVAQ